MDEDKWDSEGWKAAREWARWFIGDATWADQILRAYFDPSGANATLNAEQND